MRYAIISDIHANLEALQSVLADIDRRGGADRIWCLGDVVGYGPDPHECIELLKKTDLICVAGNHDLAAIGKVSTDQFNPDAAEACLWAAKQLIPADVAYIERLPLTIEQDGFTIVHGSPREPVWNMSSTSRAQENFAYFKTAVCRGHTHVPAIFTSAEGGECSGWPFADAVSLAVTSGGRTKLIINPAGSDSRGTATRGPPTPSTIQMSCP